ncbi:MAG: hypothetical protein IIA07_06450 [Proteobacteria bacterium]|nr:hypothetical protein [Pseudomonadota bacterium]
MKTFVTTVLVCALVPLSSAAQADWSANLGFASEYYYRGILQESTSASAGLAFENSGFYAGTWAADVGDGLEIDGYFGYGADVGEIHFSIGYTGYFYTGDFDDTYQEINLGASMGMISLDVAIGKYNNFVGPTLDYTYYSLTVEKSGFHGKFAGFSQDFEGAYFEAGYATRVADIDIGLTLIFSNEDLMGNVDEAIVLTLGKSFDF